MESVLCVHYASHAEFDNNIYCLIHLMMMLIIIINYIFIALFSTLKVLYIWQEESPQPPPMCSIHLHYVTAAIVRQNAHKELKPIIIPYGDD